MLGVCDMGLWIDGMVMKVIRHVGVNSRMISLDDQACQQITNHFNATFHPSRASSDFIFISCMPDEACGRNVALK